MTTESTEGVVANFVVFYYTRRKEKILSVFRKPGGSTLTEKRLKAMYKKQGQLLEQMKSDKISFDEYKKKTLALEKKVHWRENTFMVRTPEEIHDCLAAVEHPAEEETERMTLYGNLIHRFLEENQLPDVVVYTLTVGSNGSLLSAVGGYDFMPEAAPDGSIATTSVNDHFADAWTKETTLDFYTFMAKSIPQAALSDNSANLLAGL